ncbi:MAG: hypothetical protein K8T89_07310 [Planctomycetes bacterium]|nr:hypothetical protein [Planctomycetota bacterium]
MRRGPGAFLARAVMEVGDKDQDGKLSKDEAIAAAKKLFAAIDVDKRGSLNEKALADGLNEVLLPPGVPAVRGRGPGGPVTNSLLRKANVDREGKLSTEQFAELAAAFLKEWDTDKNGSLDGKEIEAGLTGLIPPPKFGPPGEQGKVPPKGDRP